MGGGILPIGSARLTWTSSSGQLRAGPDAAALGHCGRGSAAGLPGRVGRDVGADVGKLGGTLLVFTAVGVLVVILVIGRALGIELWP